MARLFACIFAVLAVSFSAVAERHNGSEDPAFDQINAIVKSLSEITGLAEKRPVPYARMSKRQLRQFLAKRIKKTVRPEEIHADEIALKMFGLVPQDFDLKKSTIDLLTEQAAAFYDYDDKKLFLLEDASLSAELTTLAHELAHAVADQHFDLSKFMDDNSADDDENLARTAVVEGQASWLMIAYDLKQAHQPPVPTPEMLESIAESGDSSFADYPVLKASPLYIQQSLLFPYAHGPLFFDAVYKRQGKEAFATVFRAPPTSSAQVIHPDRYFSHEKASKPTLPKLPVGGHRNEISEGSLGEFDHEILLEQYLNKADAEALAPHLRGSDFKITGNSKQQNPVLLYASDWDSAENAAVFFDDYQKILRLKWKRCEVTAHSANLAAGQGDDGYFVARLAGTVVTSMEGLPEPPLVESLTTGAKAPQKLSFFRQPPER
jgi:hypothetical protein